MIKYLSLLIFMISFILASAFSCSSKEKVTETQRMPSSKELTDFERLDQNWLDRGIEARDNLGMIENRFEQQDMCIKDFERAFYYFTIPEHAYVLKAKQATGMVYTFNILHGSELRDDPTFLKMTMVNFYYDTKGSLIKVDVPILARGWRMQMSSNTPNGFMIDNSKCYYFININDPFESGVLSIKSDGKDI
ncbi:hypothetical protein [Bacteriovorax sp. BAL6_X]|uniref:hypothetical protein n=1 Tax=Bacteriovorax sp. BAL6_X TaxID=1201290 RepID=UPI00041123F2|nr:hypothetical protein [Bacteriovorax sp. BAL6_X]